MEKLIYDLMRLHLVRARVSQSVESPRDAAMRRALAALKELGYGDISKVDLARLTPTDAFEEELMVMANVRAYFQVAYKACFLPLVYKTRCSSRSPLHSVSSTTFP